MTDTRLTDVLNGKEENYILPFYWQHGGKTDEIPAQIQRIYDSGCRALCVESRPHKDFGGNSWWADMDVIIAEAKKREMKVWILDDDHFPTGHANGLIAKKYPHLRGWSLTERHIDVVGPMKNASLIVEQDNTEMILKGAYAYKRNADDNESCDYEAINLTDSVQDGWLYWDIPDGVWRVFLYYVSRLGISDDYIDMISPESVDVQIEAAYEPHYKHYAGEFGKTIAGFFSDEPCFRNQIYGQQRVSYGFYESRIGTRSLSLPWNEALQEMMKDALGFDPIEHANLLWFEDDTNGDNQATVRMAYMDAVTKLYRDCFCRRLANWCHEHGVEYIGHIIEDMNAHAHLTWSCGHYFRALECQDMSGIDVVLHQVMPGMVDYIHTSSCATGVADGAFYQYILPKLGASLAHLNPNMKGRAMCEVFGAYGWAEDSITMKWLIDFLLVRGINHFVPHAFSPDFPDPDCPPHFGAEGHDPNFEAFSALMRYTNKAAHLLTDAVHVANAAILYHAEGEWSSRYRNAMFMEKPAKKLYDAHIDFDIVSADMLEHCTCSNRKLHLNNETFDALIIPYADHLPQSLLQALKHLQNNGLPVLFIDTIPDNIDFKGETVALDAIADVITERRFTDVSVCGNYPHLRIYHCRRDSNDIFMLMNEDFSQAATTAIDFNITGSYVRLDMLNDICETGNTVHGSVKIDLVPSQSQIIVFGDTSNLELPCECVAETAGVALNPGFSLELADSDNLDLYENYGEFTEFFSVCDKNHKPGFSGKMRYRFNFSCSEKSEKMYLNLGTVGQNASLKLNGTDMGIRICPPYRFDITDACRIGDNTVEVIVSNTLAGKIRDRQSKFMQLAPSGLCGGLVLEYCYSLHE